MYCLQCSTQLPDESKFCLQCGALTNSFIDSPHEVYFHDVASNQHDYALQLNIKRSISFLIPISFIFMLIAIWQALLSLKVLNIYQDSILEILVTTFTNLLPIIIGLGLISCLVGIVFGLYYTKKLRTLGKQAIPLVGIHGWLIPVLFNVLTTAFVYTINASVSIGFLFEGIPEALTNTMSEQYIPGFEWSVWFVLFCEIIFALASIYTLSLLLQHKRLFIKSYISLVWALVSFDILDIIYSLLTLPNVSMQSEVVQESLLRGIVIFLYALVWGSYVHFSKRVKNTFIKE